MAEVSIARGLLESQIGEASAAELRHVLGALLDGVHRILGGALVGVYLNGSFALKRGDSASDVDFLVVASRELTQQEEDDARELHRSLPDRPEHWAHHLEGSWVSTAALRDPVGAHDPWLYVDNGSRIMERSRHDDTWNSRWIFRNSAVALYGPAAASLVPEVRPSDVRSEAVSEADARQEWVRNDPEAVRNGWAQPFIVLTCCRLVWSAAFGTITSKAGAAEWVRDEVAPAEFERLVTAAIKHRVNWFDQTENRADPRLVAPTEEFVTWATAEVHRRADSAL